MMRLNLIAPALSALALAACSSTSGPAVDVHAALETPSVGTAAEDAADDPAIWAAAQPVRFGDRMIQGFVAGTDKKAGLYIYGLDGQVLQFLADGLLNNVDVVEGLTVNGRPQVLIGASDRTAGKLGAALYLFDPADQGDNRVRPWGQIVSDLEEPYGFCFAAWNGRPHAILIGKDGQVRQLEISADSSGRLATREVRRFAIGSISEGCAADEASGSLFLGEELVGVWRYGLDPASGDARTPVAQADRNQLTADVEGATVLIDGADRYLIVSSQGDSAFAVFRIEGQGATFVGRFRVAEGATDAVTGTDGVDALGGRVGDAFPDGLVVVQDDVNDGAQNFKFIDWRVIRQALGL